ncbi:MAG: hypothetical protein C4315_03160 [Chloroflexota bacterium]
MTRRRDFTLGVVAGLGLAVLLAFLILGDDLRLLLLERLNPPAAAAEHYGRALQLMDEGRRQAAIDELTKSIELNPTDPKLYDLRAHLYAATGQAERALQDMARVFQLDPSLAQNRYPPAQPASPGGQAHCDPSAVTDPELFNPNCIPAGDEGKAGEGGQIPN